MTPQETKKYLVQSLVLSKPNFNDSVTYPLPVFLQKRVPTTGSECYCWFCFELLLLRKERP